MSSSLPFAGRIVWWARAALLAAAAAAHGRVKAFVTVARGRLTAARCAVVGTHGRWREAMSLGEHADDLRRLAWR